MRKLGIGYREVTLIPVRILAKLIEAEQAISRDKDFDFVSNVNQDQKTPRVWVIGRRGEW